MADSKDTREANQTIVDSALAADILTRAVASQNNMHLHGEGSVRENKDLRLLAEEVANVLSGNANDGVLAKTAKDVCQSNFSDLPVPAQTLCVSNGHAKIKTP